MATTGRRSIPEKDFRVDVALVGSIDGINQTFALPEVCIQDPPNLRVTVYYNGVRQREGSDFTVVTSSGPLTGDTISLLFAPLPGDSLTADYIVSV